jgi:hypothetical protein
MIQVYNSNYSTINNHGVNENCCELIFTRIEGLINCTL